MRTPGAQILIYKCHFPLKGTKAPGEMAGSRVWSGESEKKSELGEISCQEVASKANRIVFKVTLIIA